MKEPRTFRELQENGILWAINRYIFHPRGFALAFHLDPDGEILGWSLEGDGSETWRFEEADDDDGMDRFESFIRDAPDAHFADKVLKRIDSASPPPDWEELAKESG